MRPTVLVAASSVAWLASFAPAQSPVLFPVPRFPAGDGVADVAVADFDGDAILDLATSNASADTLTLLRGVGGARFRAPEVVATAEHPEGLAAGDLDGDGWSDLLVAHRNARRIAVHVGQGDGTFGPALLFPVGETPEPIALGDLDLDGVLDALVGCRDDGAVHALLGTGTGRLRGVSRTVTGRWPEDVLLADITADGQPDAAVANSHDRNVVALAGTGAGAFAAPLLLDADAEALALAVAELTGDALPDLVAATSSHTRVWPAAGGAFGLPVQFSGGSTEVLAGDFDGDGDADVLPSSSSGGPLLVQVAPGVLEKGAGRHPGPALSKASVVDLDGDGALDIAAGTAGPETADVAVIRGLGDGSFESPPSEPAPGTHYPDALLADFDLDGRLDFAQGIETAWPNHFVELRAGQGDGSFAAPLPGLVISDPRVILSPDLDADGDPDLVATSAGPSYARVALNAGGLTFVPQPDLSVGKPPAGAAAADFDLDGELDLAIGHFSPSLPPYEAGIRVWRGKGNGTFFKPGAPVVVTDPYLVRSADFDADGLMDLVASTGTSMVELVLASGPATFGPAQAFPTDGLATGLAAADLDADGFTDLAVAQFFLFGPTPYAHAARVLHGAGDGTLVPAQHLLKDHRAHDIRAHDVDGDGDLDLLLGLDAPARTCAVALGEDGGLFGTPRLHALPLSPYRILPGDLDGDGSVDLVLPGTTAAFTVLLGLD